MKIEQIIDQLEADRHVEAAFLIFETVVMFIIVGLLYWLGLQF